MIPHKPVMAEDFDDLQAAIDHARDINSYVILQPKEYYTTGLKIYHHTRIIGYGAKIINSGNSYISGSVPIIPAADDVAGQTWGACFSDDEPGTTFSPHFEGFKIQGFRYAFCSAGYAWYHPTFINMSSEAVNIFFFAYQGAQNPRFLNISGTFNCLFAGHATCFSSTHPFRGQDNVFTDGVQVLGMGASRPGVHPNDALDAWFEAAILRPSTPSTWIAETRIYELEGSWRKVSGRLVYLPGRNRRMVYSLRICDVSMETSTRGLVCVRAPHHMEIENIGGENIFHNPDYTESMVLTTPGNGTFKNIQVNQADSNAKVKACIEVVEDTQYAYPYEQYYYANNCEGNIIGWVHKELPMRRITTAERNSIQNPEQFMIIGNVTTGKLNFYFNGWKQVTSVVAP